MTAKRLLLEGRDDKHVVQKLLYHHNLHEDFDDFKDKEGIEKLLATLAEEIEATDVERLGIVIDADLDLSRQWARVTGVLIRCGFKNGPQDN